MRLAAVATAAAGAYALGWLSRQPQVDAARREANTDALTGLANRSELKRQLRNRADHAKSYTIYMIDLNGFKPVNDTYGHRAGDELLRRLGMRLSCQLAGNLVSRVGGDEFVVVVDGELVQPGLLAGRIQHAISGPVHLPGSPEPVSLSAAIGFAHAGPGHDPRVVLHYADLAMYRSKAMGMPAKANAPIGRTVDESPRIRVRDTRHVRVA